MKCLEEKLIKKFDKMDVDCVANFIHWNKIKLALTVGLTHILTTTSIGLRGVLSLKPYLLLCCVTTGMLIYSAYKFYAVLTMSKLGKDHFKDSKE